MHIYFQSYYDNQYESFKAKQKKSVMLTEAQLRRVQRNDKIISLFSKGVSKTEIVRRLGVSSFVVSNVIKALNQSSFDCAFKTRIIESLKLGKTLEQIVAEECVSKYIVKRIAEQANIRITTELEAKKKKEEAMILELLKDFSREDVAEKLQVCLSKVILIARKYNTLNKDKRNSEILKLLSEGVSVKQISSELGVSKSIVTRVARNHNICSSIHFLKTKSIIEKLNPEFWEKMSKEK